MVLFGLQYSHIIPFYEPCNSNYVHNIVIGRNKLAKLIQISLKSVVHKCFRYPLCDDSDLIIPLLQFENFYWPIVVCNFCIYFDIKTIHQNVLGIILNFLVHYSTSCEIECLNFSFMKCHIRKIIYCQPKSKWHKK